MVGKILVANVVINRVNSKRFPNNVSGVINANRQFAPVTSGIINTTTASSDTKKAVARALSGEDYSDGALFFISRSHCSKSSAAWFDDNFDKVVEHGGHEFFK
jgi:N-acetylmuramoyl-L-alanine amidase